MSLSKFAASSFGTLSHTVALFDSSKIMEKGWYLLLYRLKRMYCNVERDIVRMGQNMQKSKACVEAVFSISNVPMVSSKKECLVWMLKPEKYILNLSSLI